MAVIEKGEQGEIPCSFFVNKRLYPFEGEFLSIKKMIARSIGNE